MNRYWKNMTSDNVIYLLLEINPDLVERILIVPHLEKLFDEIGVIRKVGITHASKYLKKAYTSLSINHENISASWNGIDANISSIVHLSTRSGKEYKSFSKEEFESHHKYMMETYGEKGKKVKFETKTLSFKTPVMADTLNSNGIFSTSYLQHAYENFKLLKRKHENQKSNLDDLLDI